VVEKNCLFYLLTSVPIYIYNERQLVTHPFYPIRDVEILQSHQVEGCDLPTGKKIVSALLLRSHQQVRARFYLTLLSAKVTFMVHFEKNQKTGPRQNFRPVLLKTRRYQKIQDDRSAPGFLVRSRGADHPRQDSF
jgi:hypothetical protein